VRRLLSEIAAYLGDLGRSAARGWRGFFFTPADPTPLGLIRVLVGALLFWDLAVLGLDLNDYLGADGWIGPEAVRQFLAEQSPRAWSFWLWVPDRWLFVAWSGGLVVTALFTLGLGSRVTAVLSWAIAISTVRRAPVALFGFDHMVSTWAFYLAVSGASGQSLSLDRFLARYRALRRGASESGAPTSTVSANLGLRLIQLHLVLIYGSCGLSKLMGPEWWNGSAMEMILLTPEFRRFDLAWVAAYPALLSLATHAGVVLEIAYPVLIWVGKLRPLLLVSAAMMHFGIDLLLGLTEFGLAMIAANLAFASGGWLRGMVTGSRQPLGVLHIDGQSPRNRALAAFLLANDPDRLLQSVAAGPEARGARLVTADGRTAEGVDAVLIVARWMPLLWPIGLLGILPGTRPLLRRAFRSRPSGGKGDDRPAARASDGLVRGDARDEKAGAGGRRSGRPTSPASR
jgi:hypothetical protein